MLQFITEDFILNLWNRTPDIRVGNSKFFSGSLCHWNHSLFNFLIGHYETLAIELLPIDIWSDSWSGPRISRRCKWFRRPDEHKACLLCIGNEDRQLGVRAPSHEENRCLVAAGVHVKSLARCFDTGRPQNTPAIINPHRCAEKRTQSSKSDVCFFGENVCFEHVPQRVTSVIC